MRTMGTLESDVMDILWESAEAVRVRDVLHQLDRDPPLAYTTVMTVLDNLHRKGFVERRMEGRAYLYSPTRPRAEYAAELMNELLDGSGDRPGTLLRFVDGMSPAERRALQRLLGKDSRRRRQ